MMQEHELLDEVDDGGPFSPRELLLGLGAAMAWVSLSATLVMFLPVGLL